MNIDVIATLVSVPFAIVLAILAVRFFVTKVSTAPSSEMLEQCYLSSSSNQPSKTHNE